MHSVSNCSLFALRQILLVMVASSVTLAAEPQSEGFPNELNADIEEPKIFIPEIGQDSPFHSISNTRPIDSNDPLVATVQQAVDATRRRLLSTNQHTPWQIMHGLLALRQDFDIRHNGTVTPAINWISTGPVYDNEYWFEKTRHGGRAHPYNRPYAFEGHANQFLAILSMSGLPLDHSFQTASGPITMKDMLRNAQMTVNNKDEVTWTLWALSRYLPPDAEWINERGEPWSIEHMVKIQTDKPLKGSACGGTHGLFALAHARNVYLRQGRPLRGVWLEAEYKIRKHINIARMQQNTNGTLSSNFFRGRSYEYDFNKRMASAGHVLEFLMIALPQEELQEQWVRRAIDATAKDLLNNRRAYVKCSPLYHAVNGLSIYLLRVKNNQPNTDVAESATETKTAAADGLKPVKEGETPLKSLPVTSISSSTEKDDNDKSAKDEEMSADKQTDSTDDAAKEEQSEKKVDDSDKPETESSDEKDDEVTVVSNRMTVKIHPASSQSVDKGDMMVDPIPLKDPQAKSSEGWKARNESSK